MKKLRRIALAYIRHGDRLLVFREPEFPEAGIQVPGGTLEEDESPEEGVMREAFEETGLSGLRLSGFLGEYEYDFAKWNEIHRCHCYHLVCEGRPPERWRHEEMTPDGSKEPITFELFWVKLPDEVPPLTGNQDKMLPKLAEQMSRDAQEDAGLHSRKHATQRRKVNVRCREEAAEEDGVSED